MDFLCAGEILSGIFLPRTLRCLYMFYTEHCSIIANEKQQSALAVNENLDTRNT
jgi:hypothetical protein